MQQRALGRSGINVPPVIFGCNVFGWTADQAMTFRLLDACLESGLIALDTADVYSAWVPGHTGGESETLIGAWLKARPGARDKVLILTKCGIEMPGKGKGLSAGYIARAVEDSLVRLGIERIDLYQSHRDDEVTPPEETLGAYQTLIKAGKVRAIGASNFSPARLRASLDASAKHGLPRYESMQPQYNLMERAIEADIVPLCVEYGVGIIPYYSLASGFLTGKYRSKADLSKSARGARGMEKYLDARGMRVLAALDQVAAQHKVTLGQVALAWQFAKPGITAPIASATNLDQFAELVKAASLRLDAAEVAALDQASVA